MITAPKKCLCCGSEYVGGHALPGQQMREGLRIFFDCGASMSCKILGAGVFQILFKNCQNEFPDSNI